MRTLALKANMRWEKIFIAQIQISNHLILYFTRAPSTTHKKKLSRLFFAMKSRARSLIHMRNVHACNLISFTWEVGGRENVMEICLTLNLSLMPYIVDVFFQSFFHHNAENWYEIKSCCYAEFFVIRFDLFSSSARFSSSPSDFPLL